MSLEIILVHTVLSIFLFFIINFLGKQSLYMGYSQMSLFVKSAEAPAFNFIFRILTPIVYIIIVATILYRLNLDAYTKNIYLVNIYYMVFRVLFNLCLGRKRLVNWFEQISYNVIILFLSVIIYDELIKTKQNILPDFSTISNELWIIILLFLYNVFNKLEIPAVKTQKRLNRHINHNLSKYKTEFGKVVSDKIDNERLSTLIYAIMLFEDFNRPKLYRIIEILLFHLGLAKTTGIMQVKANKNLSDKERVRLSIEKILDAYPEVIKDSKKELSIHRSYFAGLAMSDDESESLQFVNQEIEKRLLILYNPSYEYASEVMQIRKVIADILFGKGNKLSYVIIERSEENDSSQD